MNTVITYKIESDQESRLKAAARTACNFWNRFVSPKQSIVIRLGIFENFGNVIARAYRPYNKGLTTYGVVEFNTRFLVDYSDAQVAGTVVHEIGHTLGIGWDTWMPLFESATGKFTAAAINSLPALAEMQVETDYGAGTELVHWDELAFGSELMTGFKNENEFVLPVTIDVIALFGHKVLERLNKKTPLNALLTTASSAEFAQKDFAKSLDLDHFVKTPIWEEIYTNKKRKKLI